MELPLAPRLAIQEAVTTIFKILPNLADSSFAILLNWYSSATRNLTSPRLRAARFFPSPGCLLVWRDLHAARSATNQSLPNWTISPPLSALLVAAPDFFGGIVLCWAILLAVAQPENLTIPNPHHSIPFLNSPPPTSSVSPAAPKQYLPSLVILIEELNRQAEFGALFGNALSFEDLVFGHCFGPPPSVESQPPRPYFFPRLLVRT